MPRAREARQLAAVEPGLAERLLAELIYERVRLTVDFFELSAFEEDLAASIERALAACEVEGAERNALIYDYLARAWDRVTDDVLTTVGQKER